VAAQRTELEGKLVDIWQEVLGKKGIGVHDNFFDLGGDSIKSIQLGSRIRKHGYALTVADILRHPVLEEMAAKAQRFTRQAEQGLVTGAVPLSPVQRRFWEQTYPHKHYFNQSVLLRSKAAMDVEGIRHVFAALCAHHDGLRTRYRQEGGEERQEIGADANAFSLDAYDWREHGSARTEELIAAAGQDLQAGIDLQAGPLVKLGLFQCSDGDRLLIVIHHLVVDGVAWRVLFEDITTLYHQHEQGLSLRLPPKSDSFKYWMAQQQAYARSSVLLGEIPYWKNLEMTGGDPVMPPGVPVKILEADVDSVSFSLDAPTTQQLQTIANKAYNTQVEDLLLTALGISFREVLGTQQLLIDLEGHGRQDLGTDADVSRTVGWFTSQYPVLLSMKYPGNLAKQLIEVKETLRLVPAKGIGYGILKYMSDPEAVADLAFSLNPEVCFNYLGHFHATPGREDQPFFTFSGEDKGRDVHAAYERPYPVEVSATVFHDCLRVRIEYSPVQFGTETMQRLVDSYEQALLALVRHCLSVETVQVTPSDLGDPEMPMEVLEDLFN
jgi:surfactin family lipopeptide synthetase A